MDRFYRVYVSVSPALNEPRIEIMLPTLLKLGLMPVWADREADWDIRKGLINSCDYFLLCSGYSYVARPPNGVSWQHSELNLARIKQIPVFAATVDAECLEAAGLTPDVLARLKTFRAQLNSLPGAVWKERREIPRLLARHWPSFAELAPRPGWIRHVVPLVAPEEFRAEEAESEFVVEPLPEDIQLPDPGLLTEIPDWFETSENFSFTCEVYTRGNCQTIMVTEPLSWGDIFETLCRALMPKGTENHMNTVMSGMLEQRFRDTVLNLHPSSHAAVDFRFTEMSERMIRLKLRRAGLIRKDNRASQRHHVVWELTDKGQMLGTVSA